MEQNQEPVPDTTDVSALRQQMVDREIAGLREKVAQQFKDGELQSLKPADVAKKVSDWLASTAVEGPKPPPAEVTVNPETGTMTIKVDRRFYPWIKPTIRDYMLNWAEQAREGKVELMVAEEDAKYWSREDWLVEFRRVGGELSKQMSTSPPNEAALLAAEDEFVLFRLMAEACGYQINIGWPEGMDASSDEPVMFTVQFDYPNPAPAEEPSHGG